MLEGAARLSCPHCGAALESRKGRCAYCGSYVEAARSGGEVYATCKAFLEGLEAEIKRSASPVMILTMLALIASFPLTYWAVKRLGVGPVAVWVWTVLICVLLFAVWGGIINREEKKKYRRELRPRVLAFLKAEEIEADELLRVARLVLDSDSVLLSGLTDLYER